MNACNLNLALWNFLSSLATVFNPSLINYPYIDLIFFCLWMGDHDIIKNIRGSSQTTRSGLQKDQQERATLRMQEQKTNTRPSDKWTENSLPN